MILKLKITSATLAEVCYCKRMVDLFYTSVKKADILFKRSGAEQMKLFQ